MALSNDEVADVLEEIGEILRVQGANPYRARAYHDAARTLRGLVRPIAAIAEREGRAGLDALPGIGESLAATIDEIVHTGRSRLLDRLKGECSPEDLFATVPGIGEALAGRIHREIGVETLEELELAAHDGRLEGVKGFGSRRARLVRETLAGMLARSSRRRARTLRALESETAAAAPERPPASLLLAIDRRYRDESAAGRLRTIAPRRFNPEGRSWLPVLHADEGGWSFTALFSNSARAHELGRTRDWVVIYFERAGREDQCTVVTETTGLLEGKRVVRGRETECAAFYAGGADPG